jgi:hypothetical protein
MGGTELGLYPVVDCSVPGVDQSVSATAMSIIKTGVKMG